MPAFLRSRRLLIICLLTLSIIRIQGARADEVKLLQNFEGNIDVHHWPDDGHTEISTDWASDGKHSLKISKDTLASIEDMTTHDWSGYQVWRFHCHVPGSQAALLGIEFADKGAGYLNRYQGAATAAPGDSVVEIDISGDLWRGEVNHPYRDIKTPLDKKNIQRFAITAQSGDVYIDQIELVKVTPLTTPGGFAFQFGPPLEGLQRDWIGIHPSTSWNEAKGYGLTGGARANQAITPYPTPVMGAGVTLGDAEFDVRLGGGKYVGWVIFERSGFWEGQQASYRNATLSANGQVVHRDVSDPAAAFFQLQDTEILNEDQLVNQMILPVQHVADIAFTAVNGKNAFKLTADGEAPPRLAGLLLAPDTPAGGAFIEAHKKIQNETIRQVHRLTGAQQRDGDPAHVTEPLVVVPLPSDAVMRPGDWPSPKAYAKIPDLQTMPGLLADRVVGIYATQDLQVTAKLSPLIGAGTAAGATIPSSAVHLQRNVYMPIRGYGQTGCTIETHHYVPADTSPADTFPITSTVARSLLLQIQVPADAKPGNYKANLSLFYSGPKSPQSAPNVKQFPISLQVHAGTLPGHEFPVGLFASGVPASKELIGDDLYWKLSEDFMRQMQLGSLTILTGGPDYTLNWNGKTPVYSGDDCVRLIHLGHQYGLDMKVVEYGGFSLGVGHTLPEAHAGMSVEDTVAAMARAWQAFRAKNSLPEHFVNAYDEPTTPSDFEGLEHRLTVLRAAGFPTNGYTSVEDPAKVDADHAMLAKLTHAPTFGNYSPETLQWVLKQGNEPWLYGGDLSRQSFGVDLWRAHRYGAAGRFGWIASIVQGFQYDTLDAREPDPSCFFIHKTLGVLIAPCFLGVVEGGVDCRLLFELEHRAAGSGPAADSARAIVREVESLPFRKPMTWDELESLRGKMFAALDVAAP